MNTDKEIAAFVDRMAKHLHDVKGSRRGRHRAGFIAVRPLIEAALCRGHTLKATWEALREDKKLSMTYETFRHYCRAMALGGATPAGPAGHGQARQPRLAGSISAPQALFSGTPKDVHSVPPTAQDLPAASNERNFRHERVPRTDKIYG